MTKDRLIREVKLGRALDALIRKASDGNIEALEFLDSRGYIDLAELAPSEDQQVYAKDRAMVAMGMAYAALIARCEKGDIDAIQWLEDRGIIDFPLREALIAK